MKELIGYFRDFDKLNDTQIGRWAIALIVITIVPALIYIVNFNFWHIPSLDPTHNSWSAFGDFMSGTIGVILALINLLIFIVLTFLINKFQRSNEKQNIDAQRKLVEYNMRNEAYNSFNKTLDEIFKLLTNFFIYEDKSEQKKILRELNIIENIIESFIASTEDYLFKCFKVNENKDKLKGAVTELIKSINRGFEIEKKPDSQFFQSDLSKAQEDFLAAFLNFKDVKSEIIKSMQTEIIEESKLEENGSQQNAKRQ